MASTTNPTHIINASLESINGRPPENSIYSITGVADCTSPNGRYTTELHSAAGDRLLFKQIHPGRPPFTAVINKSRAWTIDAETGEVQSLDGRSAAMVMGHDFLMLPFVLDRRFHNPILVGTTKFHTAPCRKIQATNRYKETCDLYFAANTHRFLGLTIHNANPVNIYIAMWQPHQDILLPEIILITESGGEYRFDFHHVALNAVDESIFAIPSEIQQSLISEV